MPRHGLPRDFDRYYDPPEDYPVRRGGKGAEYDPDEAPPRPQGAVHPKFQAMVDAEAARKAAAQAPAQDEGTLQDEAFRKSGGR